MPNKSIVERLRCDANEMIRKGLVANNVRHAADLLEQCAEVMKFANKLIAEAIKGDGLLLVNPKCCDDERSWIETVSDDLKDAVESIAGEPSASRPCPAHTPPSGHGDGHRSTGP